MEDNNIVFWIIFSPVIIIGAIIGVGFIYAIFQSAFDIFNRVGEFIFEYLYNKVRLPHFLALLLSLLIGLLAGIITIIVLIYIILLVSGNCAARPGLCSQY